MVVDEIMSEFVISATPETSLGTALRVMTQKSIRHLPIVDEEGVMGVLGKRQFDRLAEFVGSRQEYADLLDKPVSEFLPTRFTRARDVVVARVGDGVKEVIEVLLAEKVGALPVLCGEGELVGIVSYIDVLEALKDHVE